MEALVVVEGEIEGIDVMDRDSEDALVAEAKDASAIERASDTGGRIIIVEPTVVAEACCVVLIPVSGMGSGIDVESVESAGAFSSFLLDFTGDPFCVPLRKSLGWCLF